MTDMEERELKAEDIPMKYPLCFNGECGDKDRCMHYQARQCVHALFSGGNGPYNRVHHGENMLSPQKQEEILAVLAKFGSIEGIRFDHYVTDWNFE